MSKIAAWCPFDGLYCHTWSWMHNIKNICTNYCLVLGTAYVPDLLVIPSSPKWKLKERMKPPSPGFLNHFIKIRVCGAENILSRNISVRERILGNPYFGARIKIIWLNNIIYVVSILGQEGMLEMCNKISSASQNIQATNWIHGKAS